MIHHKIARPPIIFTEFFDLGLPEDRSPFLTPSSRLWAKNLELRLSLLSIFLLTASYLLLPFDFLKPLSYLTLSFVYMTVGVPSLIDSVKDISRLEVNIDVLMVLAAFSSILIGSPHEGALLLVLFALSHAMEDAVTSKASGAINSLYKIAPTSATVLTEEGTALKRSVKDIKINERILIKAGEFVPLDGIVEEGSCSLNLVHLTGENLPVTKTVGDEVAAGGHNLDGTLTLRVSKSSTDSTISRIINLVTQAQEAKPQLQRWFDKVSQRYALSIISLTIFFIITIPWVFNIPYLGFEGSFYRSIAFLIAASPCALIIATPIAYLSAISACAGKGILLKGGAILDALDQCEIVAFDKTGTLTTGDLQLIDVRSLNHTAFTHEEAIRAAFTLEFHAVHPIARSIVNYANEKKMSRLKMENFRAVPGFGVQGEIEIREKKYLVFMGSEAFILPTLSDKNLLNDPVNAAKEKGLLVAVLSLGASIYLLTFEDGLRKGLDVVFKELKKERKIELLMLTGDHAPNAKRVAEALGIDNYLADLKPEDKLSQVGNIAQNRHLAMIGDGVNDAPALARASVGIGMGQIGSSSALEASDIIFLHDNIERLSWLFRKAHQTRQIVRQNLSLAGAVILLATTPALLAWIPLWMAVVLHEGGTVLVGLNALRLLERKTTR